MGIEWKWIFQRPQILAEKLQEYYDVTVVCPKQIKGMKSNGDDTHIAIREMLQIPYQEKNSDIRRIAISLHKKCFADIERFDIVWIDYPIYYRYIPKSYKGIVIYDCMDNYQELFPDQKKEAREYVSKMEQSLIDRSNIIFASSSKLKKKICNMNHGKEVTLIRNGCFFPKNIKPELSIIRQKYVIGYVGSVSKWIDTAIITKSLKVRSYVIYRFIGPVYNYSGIHNERVQYTGTVEHSKLYDKVKDIDCLIMPFIINNITEYVDPVKFYEYVLWGKCIVASYYPELERFSDFVYFYHNTAEYLDLIDRLCKEGFPAKYSEDKQKEFLLDNTWECRIKEIESVIRGQDKENR